MRRLDSCSAFLTFCRSGYNRRPSRLAHTPAIITESTLAMPAWVMTLATGSCTGHMLSAVASSSTRSACLPGVSVPMRSAMRSMRAPSTLIHSSASRQRMVAVGGKAPVLARTASLSMARCVDSASRATVNMSPEAPASRSAPSDGRAPSLRSRPVMAKPCPCAISVSGVSVKVTPFSSINASWASVRLLPWTMLLLSPSNPSAPRRSQPSGVRGSAPAQCIEAIMPNSRASLKSLTATSYVE